MTQRDNPCVTTAPDGPLEYELRALLEMHLDWVERRCRRAARSFPESDAEDLIANVVVEFLTRAPGWFANGSTVSAEARAAALLRECVRHEITCLIRERLRRGDLPTNDAGDDPITQVPSGASTVEDRAVWSELLDRVQQIKSPIRRVALLALEAPDAVLEDEFLAAARDRTGGNAFLKARAASVAWQAFSSRLAAGVPHGSAWRAELAVLFYATTSTEAASAYDRLVSHARKDLARIVELEDAQ